MAGKLTWQDVLVSVLGHIFRFPSVLAFTNVLSILILFLQPLQVTGKTVIIFTIITTTIIIIIITLSAASAVVSPIAANNARLTVSKFRAALRLAGPGCCAQIAAPSPDGHTFLLLDIFTIRSLLCLSEVSSSRLVCISVAVDFSNCT